MDQLMQHVDKGMAGLILLIVFLDKMGWMPSKNGKNNGRRLCDEHSKMCKHINQTRVDVGQAKTNIDWLKKGFKKQYNLSEED